jgi:hypothetical protein
MWLLSRAQVGATRLILLVLILSPVSVCVRVLYHCLQVFISEDEAEEVEWRRAWIWDAMAGMSWDEGAWMDSGRLAGPWDGGRYSSMRRLLHLFFFVCIVVAVTIAAVLLLCMLLWSQLCDERCDLPLCCLLLI